MLSTCASLTESSLIDPRKIDEKGQRGQEGVALSSCKLPHVQCLEISMVSGLNGGALRRCFPELSGGLRG